MGSWNVTIFLSATVGGAVVVGLRRDKRKRLGEGRATGREGGALLIESRTCEVKTEGAQRIRATVDFAVTALEGVGFTVGRSELEMIWRWRSVFPLRVCIRQV